MYQSFSVALLYKKSHSTSTMEENMITYIGTNAGLVWNALNELGKMDVKQLKKATKIRTEKDIYAALGWLAKEEKLTFEYQDKTLLISLR